MGAAHPACSLQSSARRCHSSWSPLRPARWGAGGPPPSTRPRSVLAALPAPPSWPPPRQALRTTRRLSTDDSGDDEDGTPSPADKSELHGTIRSLSLKLDDLGTCNELVAKHGVALQRSLNELDGLRVPAESSEKLKAVNERATLFRITSNAMINVSAWPAGRGCSLPTGWSGLPLPASSTSPHPRPQGQARSLALTVG